MDTSRAETPPFIESSSFTGSTLSSPLFKPRRIESPSSINTYKQCPRKYFFQYIMKYPTSPNIHTVLGSVVHSVLEEFFDQDVSKYDDTTFESGFTQAVQNLLISNWNNSRQQLTNLHITPKEEGYYFEQAALMLINWAGKFSQKIKDQGLPFPESYQKLLPIREKEYISPLLSVRGFIDAIEMVNGKPRLMDYKTSKRFEMSNEYKLQLALYALMYTQHHGNPPNEVGLYFLKDPYQFEYTIPVNQELLDLARVEIDIMHLNTQSGNIADYPKHVSPLCKWSTGQCDFYDRCFKQKTLNDQPEPGS